MIVHVKVKQPLSNMLGLSNTSGPTDLDISLTTGTTLQDLFEQITLIHPEFRFFTDPNSNRLNDVLIVVDGVVIISTELDSFSLHDQSIVSLLGRYKGG